MNNKIVSLAFVCLLLTSMFGATLVMADGDEALTVDEISEETDIDAEELEEVIDEVTDEESDELVRDGFVRLTRFVGSVDNGVDGHLASGFWAFQNFIDTSTAADSDAVTELRRERSAGRLVIGSSTYKLERDFDVATDSYEYFDLVSLHPGTINGNLEMNLVEDYNGLERWEGTLEVTEGEFEGSWNVEASSTTNAVNRADAKAIRAEAREMHRGTDSERTKGNFWGKLFFWRA